MKIRKYKDSDFKSLMECIKELKDYESKFDEDYLVGSDANLKVFEEIGIPLKSGFGEIYLATADKEVIGFIAFNIDVKNVPSIFRNVKVVYISDLLIKESFRGMGIGSELLKKAESYAKVKSIKYIKLTAFSDNDNAINMYKKNGFKGYEQTMLKKISE